MPVGTPTAIATEADAAHPNAVPVQLHVLLAEDSPTNQLVWYPCCCRTWAPRSLPTTAAMDVLAQRASFDLILMDMRMPELAGAGRRPDPPGWHGRTRF